MGFYRRNDVFTISNIESKLNIIKDDALIHHL